jgi:hypothetical protein
MIKLPPLSCISFSIWYWKVFRNKIATPLLLLDWEPNLISLPHSDLQYGSVSFYYVYNMICMKHWLSWTHTLMKQHFYGYVLGISKAMALLKLVVHRLKQRLYLELSLCA